MTTFSFHKPIEDIEEPVLLEEDWYKARISKSPSIEPNKAMKESSENEKAGHNLVISLRLTGNTLEGADGRMFTLYPPWPSEKDETLYDGRGMKLSDAKIQRIAGIVDGFGGLVDGTDIMLEEGMEGFVYITRGLDQQGQEMQNNIDLFSGVRKVEELEGEIERGPLEEDAPF